MNKLYTVKKLAEEHGWEITRTPRDWMGFLDTSSRLYKYSFANNLLIHAQRPDASACAELETWNEKMNRWVNRGAKGIALIDDSGYSPRLRYVFDISDTHKGYNGKTPFIWQVNDGNRDELFHRLSDKYSLTASTLPRALNEIAAELTRLNLDTAMQGIEHEIKGQDHAEITDNFAALMRNSIYYTLSKRCGIDPMETLAPADFLGISDFSNLSAVSCLGTAVNELCRPVLLDIGKIVSQISLEKHRENLQKGLAISEEVSYNKNVEFSTLNREIKGGKSDEPDLHAKGRLPVPEPRLVRDRSDHADRKIRADEEDVSENKSQRNVSGNAAGRNTDSASYGGRPSGERENGSADERLDGEQPAAEQRQSDGVGGSHEQSDGDGGGNGTYGIDLQLNEEAADQTPAAISLPELPSVSEQIERIAEREESVGETYPTGEQLSFFDISLPSQEEQIAYIDTADGFRAQSAFSFIQEDINTVIMQSVSDTSRMRIYNEVAKGKTTGQLQNAIMEEYKGGRGFLTDSGRLSVWFSEEGIRLAVGTEARYVNSAQIISWEGVAKDIEELIKSGSYLIKSETAQAFSFELKSAAKELWYLHQGREI